MSLPKVYLFKEIAPSFIDHGYFLSLFYYCSDLYYFPFSTNFVLFLKKNILFLVSLGVKLDLFWGFSLLFEVGLYSY